MGIKSVFGICALWRTSAASASWNVFAVDGGLPGKCDDDLKHFKETTLGSTIVMGRRTFESMGRRVLPQRTTIVVSSSESSDSDTLRWASSLDKAIDIADTSDVYIIGGVELFNAATAVNMIDTWIISYVSPPCNTGDNILRF